MPNWTGSDPVVARLVDLATSGFGLFSCLWVDYVSHAVSEWWCHQFRKKTPFSKPRSSIHTSPALFEPVFCDTVVGLEGRATNQNLLAMKATATVLPPLIRQLCSGRRYSLSDLFCRYR
ncbi:hypothetical protein RRG08_055303 [Elysia crispata]|uniref:Uncharacterized protein n=1 Tax=Elysia crispata TaxID=231223 RepID=A0AAE1ARK7_9GAST|nr:hypothetical protein RRG08_055303 [Elysia crispata]